VSFLGDDVSDLEFVTEVPELTVASRERRLPDQSFCLSSVNDDCGDCDDDDDDDDDVAVVETGGTKTPTRTNSSLSKASMGGVYERTIVFKEAGSYAISASFDGLVAALGQ